MSYSVDMTSATSKNQTNQPTNQPTNKQVNLKPGHHTESKEYKMARIFAINYKFFEGDGVTPFPLNQSTKAISMMIT